MKTKLYAILIASSCLLIGSTNTTAREKTFGYRWNMHSTETFANAVIDSTENDTSVIFGVKFEEKGKIGTLVPVYQLDKHGAEVTASIRYKTHRRRRTIFEERYHRTTIDRRVERG